jgi:histidine triad (HIT) family protein
MSIKECIFCKIIAGEIPSTAVDETDELLVIKDINPKATIHYLIIPKKHMADVRHLTAKDELLAGKMMMMAQVLSTRLPEPQDFRIIINNGVEAGQCVFHLHMHFLAGKRIPAF